jgi:hypothetical protein
VLPHIEALLRGVDRFVEIGAFRVRHAPTFQTPSIKS